MATRRTTKQGGPWLRISTPSVGIRGHHYVLTGNAERDRRDWEAVGDALFGPAGLLEGYLSKPIALSSPQGLGLEGCLVLACIKAGWRSTTREIIESLRTYMSESTIRRKIKNLLAIDMILQDGNRFFVPRNLDDRLNRYASESGAVARAQVLDREIGGKQLRHQTAVQGGPTITRIKSIVKKSNCFYCGDESGPEGGQIEHVPPNHWGGSDRDSLLFPACYQCNAPHGSFIRLMPRRVAPPPVPEPIVTELSVTEYRRHILRESVIKAMNYAILMNKEMVSDAYDLVCSFHPQLLSVLRGAELVNPKTGIVSVVPSGIEWEHFAELLAEFEGYVFQVSGRPRLPKTGPISAIRIA